MRRYAALIAIPGYVATKLVSGLILLKVSSTSLSVASFTIFSQLLLFGALLGMFAIAGSQNGLVRQTAAGKDEAARAVSRNSALVLWAGSALLLGLPALIGASWISTVLVDGPGEATAVRGVVAAVYAGGLGQIACAQLAGRQRTIESLGAQGLGLLVGTIASAMLLVRGDAPGAAVAFYAGSLATVPVALLLSRRGEGAARANWSRIVTEVKTLLGYASAFLVLAAGTGLTLFGLRYAYQLEFGLQALGVWLVAQRISDTSTQVLGLYYGQVFVPKSVAAADDHAREQLLRVSWLIVTACMLMALGAFAIAPKFLVRVFLSVSFVAAIPGILIYMTGDVFRATTTLAMNARFARGKLRSFVAIELSATALFALFTLLGISQGLRSSPLYAYLGAYAIMAAVVILVWMIAQRRRAAGTSSIAVSPS